MPTAVGKGSDSEQLATDSARAQQRRAHGALVAISLVLFCIQVDFFALNLALPDITRAFRAGPGEVQWTISAYMLSLGSLFIVAGRLGDIFGRRRALLGGIALFCLASAACAAAPSLAVLVACRVIQGAGGGHLSGRDLGAQQRVR